MQSNAFVPSLPDLGTLSREQAQTGVPQTVALPAQQVGAQQPLAQRSGVEGSGSKSLLAAVMGVCLGVAVLLAGGSEAAAAADQGSNPRQFFSPWQAPAHGRFNYSVWYFLPNPGPKTYRYHYVIYYPKHADFVYFYNPHRQQFWARGATAPGRNQPWFWVINPAARAGTIAAIPESAYLPKADPVLPGTQDGHRIVSPMTPGIVRGKRLTATPGNLPPAEDLSPRRVTKPRVDRPLVFAENPASTAAAAVRTPGTDPKTVRVGSQPRFGQPSPTAWGESQTSEKRPKSQLQGGQPKNQWEEFPVEEITVPEAGRHGVYAGPGWRRVGPSRYDVRSSGYAIPPRPSFRSEVITTIQRRWISTTRNTVVFRHGIPVIVPIYSGYWIEVPVTRHRILPNYY